MKGGVLPTNNRSPSPNIPHPYRPSRPLLSPSDMENQRAKDSNRPFRGSGEVSAGHSPLCLPPSGRIPILTPVFPHFVYLLDGETTTTPDEKEEARLERSAQRENAPPDTSAPSVLPAKAKPSVSPPPPHTQGQSSCFERSTPSGGAYFWDLQES